MSQAGRYTGGGSAAGPVETLTGNVGGPVPPTAGNIDVPGTGVILTTGNPGTSTLTVELTNGTDGQLIIGGGAAPAWADLTSGDGSINISPGPNTLNIAVAGDVAQVFDTDSGMASPAFGLLNIVGGAGITTSGAGNTVTIDTSLFAGWTEVVASQGMDVDTGYITNDVALITLTLPVNSVVGDELEVTGKGAGGWLIAQNAGQTIYFGNQPTTTGVGGSLASTQQRDSIRLVCVTADLDWNVLSSIGNITVV